jgi:hypothetical protein
MQRERMRTLRNSSFEEFVGWYLARESRKSGQPEHAADLAPDVLVNQMRYLHAGKLRSWFSRANWTIVSLDTLDDVMRLVCMDSWETRQNRLIRESGLNNRLARNIVTAAFETDNLSGSSEAACNSVEACRRRDRIETFRHSFPELCGNERLVICSLNDDESQSNPDGNYYLHDGFGRLLAYLYLVAYEGRKYSPVEAFLAEAFLSDSAAD